MLRSRAIPQQYAVHLPRHLAKLAVILVLVLASGHAWDQAKNGRFAVVLVIEEPRLRTLIEKHVQVFAEHTDPLLTEERFLYLARNAPQEIEKLLATEGYFGPRVEHRIEQDAKALTAHFSVVAGPATTVSAFTLQFSGAILKDEPANRELREQLLKSWPLQQGSVLRSADWEKAKESLIRMLHASRFAAARIAASAADVNPPQHTATLRVEVDSGPEFFFGDLQIIGLERFPQSVVTAHNPIRPGTPYSEAALTEFQATLQGTGYFTSVFVSIPPQPELAQRVPIRVQVVENTRKRLSVGAGYSTDTGFGLLGRYDGTVFDIPGWRGRATLELSQVEQTLQGEVQLPPLVRNYVPKFGARLKREDLEGQTTISSVLGARLVRATQESELAFSVQLYRDSKEIEERKDNLKSLPLNVSATRRKVDDLLYPSRGYALNAQVGGAIEDTFSDRRFLRLYGKANYFLPLGDTQTLILRAELGAVKAGGRDGIPDDFLFRTGGSQSVRGYSFGSLGVPLEGAIVRGRYLMVGSLEMRQRVADNWWAAVFYDTGGVAESMGAIDRVSGYGAGARWRSPLGPINLDVAYADAERRLRLHFSVGYAF